MPDDSLPPESVMVHLLDPATGRVLQVWLLASQAVITIGREQGQDVLLADPYVSRQHAELRFQDGQWQLVSLGRNGITIEGRRVTEALAHNGLVFRLGSEGPTLRFIDTPPDASNSATITSDSMGKFALRFDETKVEQEVDEIAEGEYFRQLQERARNLRRQREGSG
jgi:hypothetical protein